MRHQTLMIVALTVACATAQTAGAVRFAQSVELKKGWNAIYLTVAPTETPDTLFADWPVDFVATYDSSAFFATKQYSASDSTEGAQRSNYRIWHRGDRGGDVPAGSRRQHRLPQLRDGGSPACGRHEGAIRARGPFVMKRISSAIPET